MAKIKTPIPKSRSKQVSNRQCRKLARNCALTGRKRVKSKRPCHISPSSPASALRLGPMKRPRKALSIRYTPSKANVSVKFQPLIALTCVKSITVPSIPVPKLSRELSKLTKKFERYASSSCTETRIKEVSKRR